MSQPESRLCLSPWRNELLEIDWRNSFESVSSAVDEILPQFFSGSSDWVCRCRVTSLNELCCRMRERESSTRILFEEVLQEYSSQDLLKPSKLDQVAESCCRMSRKRLVKSINIAGRLRRRAPHFGSDQSSYNLELHEYLPYEVELQTNCLNEFLAAQLDQIAQNDLGELNSMGENNLEEDGISSFEIPMILPPGRTEFPSSTSFYSSSLSSSASSRHSLSLSISDDSGISLIAQTSERTTIGNSERKNRSRLRIRTRLDRHFALKSCRQFADIVTFSCKLFNELLDNNPLLKLDFSNQSLTLNQLKIFARVECQKLRARLRFHWLAQCLSLASNESDRAPAARFLPPVLNDPDGQRPSSSFTCYLDVLARLMGDVLRRHYLEEALDALLGTLERHLTRKSIARTKLSLKLELGPDGLESKEVTSSRPEDQLKETLAFVMEEISGTCRGLPRVECQLEGSLGETSNIKILTQSDQLIELKRHQMEQLVELFINRHPKELAQGNCSRMLNARYLSLIAIINKFRVCPGELEANKQTDEPSREHITRQDSSEEKTLIGFELLKLGQRNTKNFVLVEQLEVTWRQIDLLDRLEYELKCKLETSLTFGQLVTLELDDFNASLAKILHKERLLLVRFKSDELLKLLEAIRKQMDELELNIDLETAVEDYLEERKRVRQSSQPNIEHQILLDDVPRAEEAELDQVDASSDWNQIGSASVLFEDQAKASRVAVECDEEEELLNALVNQNHLRANQHLLTEVDVTAEVPNESEMAQRHSLVAPLIESRLLLGRYKYLNDFLSNELDSFVTQLSFVLLQGVPFLCQFTWLQNWQFNTNQRDEVSQESGLEQEQLELVAEISWRAREFSLMLGESLDRLARAYLRLLHSMEMRATVLDKNLIEFDWLILKLAECRLDSSSDEAANIKQLDLIQNISNWSRKLNLRLDFLACQVELIQRESRLILVACHQEFSLFDRLQPMSQLVPPLEANKAAEMSRTIDLESGWRHEALSRWRMLASHIATFWSLTEKFELQQVKWLNSDSKRLDFNLIRGLFELEFQTKLDELCERVLVVRSVYGTQASLMRNPIETLLNNIQELGMRLKTFRRLCLPILKFLSNEHLDAEHWRRLQQILVEGDKSNDQEPQIYTTVAQLLELGVTEDLAQRLDQMSHEATIEHELSLLIEAEIKRQEDRLSSRSSRQRLESERASMEALELLDSWSEHELQLAAGRFIKTRWQLVKELNRDEQTLIDELARRLIACHLSIRRLVQLGGQLNLELSPGDLRAGKTACPNEPSKRKRHKSGMVFVRSRLSSANGQQRVGAHLLVEFLRLFTESWIESEQRLNERTAKISESLSVTRAHLREIIELLDEVSQIRASDSKFAIDRNELELSRLQRSSLRLELERELLATCESSSLELQADALRRRNECIKQISGRAIPAIRAASRALDCLGDGRSLQTLRSYRPSPPLAIRLVIEAVCLLRNVCCRMESPRPPPSYGVELVGLQQGERRLTSTLIEMGVVKLEAKSKSTTKHEQQRLRPIEAVRHYDQVRDQVVEDYWQTAWRTLNGTHSAKFLADLRRISQGTRIPNRTMAIIRRRYLSRKEFCLATVERHSKAAGQLARWLLAVDIFERVMSVVRPNYVEYLEADRALAEALSEVANRRSQIELIGRELQQNEESIAGQVNERARLVELIEDCRRGSSELAGTRDELINQEGKLVLKLSQIRTKLHELPRRSLETGARLIYLDEMSSSDRSLVEKIVSRKLGQVNQRDEYCSSFHAGGAGHRLA